ncbi:MAG: cell division protein FtsZ, partial [Neisseriaceae bacterium]|nr:cell division protein FtsZ [Neisseriaceae bacterium]
TGAAPVVAEVAKKLGILTVAVVTRPFAYEGKRQKVAQSGIEVLKEHVDSLIVIPNDKLLDSLGQDITLREAFKAADDVLCSAVTGITEIVTRPGLINIDFADIRNVMSIAGVAMMGSAEASGPDRARTATEQAISSPLLDNTSLDGARGVLVSITTAPHCLKMSEYQEVMRIIDDSAASDVDVKYGTAEDPTLDEDTIRVTLVATGLQEANAQQPNLSVRQKTGTDDAVAGGNGFGGVIQSGRGRRTRGLNLTAESFKDNAILDDFEIPTAIRRQAD